MATDDVRVSGLAGQYVPLGADRRTSAVAMQAAVRGRVARASSVAVQVALAARPIKPVAKVWWDGDEFRDGRWLHPVPVVIDADGVCWALTVGTDGALTTVKLEDL